MLLLLLLLLLLADLDKLIRFGGSGGVGHITIQFWMVYHRRFVLSSSSLVFAFDVQL